MTDERLEIWTKLVESSQLNPDDLNRLDALVSQKPELVSQLFDDRSVHRLLKLLNETDVQKEGFVKRCVNRMRFNDTSKSASDDEGLDEFQIVTRAESSVGSKLTIAAVRRRKRFATWLSGILAIASLMMIGLFIVVLNQEKFRNLSELPDSVDVDQASGDDQSLQLKPQDLESSDLSNQRALDTREDEVRSEALPELVEDLGSDGSQPIFAELYVSKDAKFGNRHGRQVGAGIYRLLNGQAIFQLDNQIKIVLMGPADIELISVDRIRPLSGRIIVDSNLPSTESFFIQWRDALLTDLNAASVLIDVKKDGSNISVSRGRLTLQPDPGNEKREPVDLDHRRLKHAFIINHESNQELPNPKVLIAHGGGNNYFAQIGVGDKQQETTMPNEFERLVKDFAQRPDDQTVHDQLSMRILDFNNRLRKLRKQLDDRVEGSGGRFFGDHLDSGAIESGGSLPFTNAREFEQFMKELKSRNNF